MGLVFFTEVASSAELQLLLIFLMLTDMTPRNLKKRNLILQ